MSLKLLIIFPFFVIATGQQFACNHDSVVMALKRPTYEFSIRILDRIVQEQDGHFVFSPLSTWLQLTALAEGAHGKTLQEIWSVTKHHKKLCHKRKMGDLLKQMNEQLKLASERSNIIIFDKLLNIKQSYKRHVENSNIFKVLLLDFNDPVRAAAKANEFIASDTSNVITDAVSTEDFNNTVSLMIGAAYFKSAWLNPFNPAYTTLEPFYAEERVITGHVNMMNQIGYFNLTYIPSIDARVLELPCNLLDNRISMLVFLPVKDTILDIYWSLKEIRLMTIFNLFKKQGVKLVNVTLPRFKINTDVDNIPELVHDMGVERIFYPDRADLQGISDYEIHASLMTQIAEIEVTEKGVSAGFLAEFLISDRVSTDFNANRPFAFMIVDRLTEIILFAGMYSTPSIY